MDSFELNKLIGAFLGVVFIVFSVSLVSDAIFSSPAPETPGYAIAVPEDQGGGEGEAQPTEESVLPLLASADPSAGETVFRRCQACHTVEQGGPNKVGPNLWGIVDAPLAHLDNFSYSAAMREASQDHQETWTYDNLDHFLLNPRGFIPGTAMSFAGLRNVQDRANVIAYLRTLSDEPAPLPEAAPAAEEGADEGGEQAPAEGGAQAAPSDDAGETAPAEAAPENGAAEDGAAPAEQETQPAAEDGAAENDTDATGETQPAPAQ